MTERYVPPTPATLQCSDGGAPIGVHRILCVGKNYADHVTEMGGDADETPPVFFMKPASCVVQSGATIPYPPATENLHYEAELVVVIGWGGADIPQDDALRHVYGYAAGNDLTRRDLQHMAKGDGAPWDMAKGFDNSAVIGAVHTVDQVGHITSAALQCHVNGDLRQNANVDLMIYPVDRIIAMLSTMITLQPGDIIMTGTPAGVGPLVHGDTCVCEVAGLSPATVTIAD